MFVYIFAAGSGAFYSFTWGSIIAIAVLFVIGWLLRRFLVNKFAQDKKDQSHAQD
jgi:flagellar biogenesis protein FliO